MQIETERLLIRDLQPGDAAPFVQMAADGSLNDVGFTPNCGAWMQEWIAEARALAEKDDPAADYLAYAVTLKDGGAVIGSVGCSWYEDLRETGVTYFIGAEHRGSGYAAEAVEAYAGHFFCRYHAQRLIATIRDENTASWKTVEKAGFSLSEIRMYRDINDEREELYRFYEITRSN